MPASTTPDAYMVCGTPRSGSTLFCGLLRATGVAGLPESYFRVPDEQSWADRWQLPRGPHGSFYYGDYVRAAIVEGSTGNGVFGARIMWGTMGQMVARLGAVHPGLAGADLDLLSRAFGRTRFVHLWRDDPVAQAVSWARAEQTGYWQGGDTVAPGREPHFDFEQIDDLVRTVREHNAAWRDWFSAFGIRPHPVRYEETRWQRRPPLPTRPRPAPTHNFAPHARLRRVCNSSAIRHVHRTRAIRPPGSGGEAGGAPADAPARGR